MTTTVNCVSHVLGFSSFFGILEEYIAEKIICHVVVKWTILMHCSWIIPGLL
jgi:hypothetical protein